MSQCRRAAARNANHVPILRYKCLICNVQFKNHLRLEQHAAVFHKKKIHRQTQSNTSCPKKPVQDGSGISQQKLCPFRQIRAFKGCVRTYRHDCDTKVKSLNSYFSQYKRQIRLILKHAIHQMDSIKSQLSLKVEFKRFLCHSNTGDDVFEYQVKMINSNMLVVLNEFESLKRFIDLCSSKIEYTIHIFERYG